MVEAESGTPSFSPSENPQGISWTLRLRGKSGYQGLDAFGGDLELNILLFYIFLLDAFSFRARTLSFFFFFFVLRARSASYTVVT